MTRRGTQAVKIARGTLALVIALTIASCASFRGSGGKVQLELEVLNNLIPPGPVYVYMIANGGIERDIGTVFGGTQVLEVKSPLELNGNYQFVAKSGSRTVTTPILVLDKSILGLRWDLERNFIDVSRRVE